MDQLRALEVFAAVAEDGSLAGAGRRLGLSPPTVTRIVNELEASLGVALLRRTTRIVTLTEAGGAYLDDVRKILEELRAAD
ncbi:MAG: LysR family transcriptional regulator, partial [Pseudomonadota bacterium]